MELEQLKEIWTSFDRRMQQQEGLKSAIIKEMLISKSDRALSRIINYNYIGVIFATAMIPVLAWCWTVAMSVNYIGRMIVPVALAFMFFAIIMGILQLKKLHQVNFSLPVSKNMCIMQRFNLFNKRNLVLSFIFGFGIAIVVIITALMSVRIESWRGWGLAAALPLCVLVAVWEYKRMYRRNIDSIMKSLEELKELEEEAEEE